MGDLKKIKVVIAMSGGVDSSVAAFLLKEMGYDVIGMMLRLWSEKNNDANRCCTPDSIDNARRIADDLDIPFYVLDYQSEFKRLVVDYFIKTYSRNLTPNPCLVCNKMIRFGGLLDEAINLGAHYLATGHYAIIRNDSDKKRLFKGLDPLKDQSYVLYKLDQYQLSHVLFPLGKMTKKEVRSIAEKAGLPVFNRPDSQDLCFIGDENYSQFLQRYAPRSFIPGEITDSSGNCLGRHKGLPAYTIGQRKGLGVSSSHPLYVIGLDEDNNRLVVGGKQERECFELLADQCHFLSGKAPVEKTGITVKTRYTAKESRASLSPAGDDQMLVRFDEPVMDVTPGQSVVFYQEDEVLGGGIIQRHN
ncbi:MAG: tRNA 2-thiouridine(34) synthase MnmA [Deltaproteobacteria bacterium]|nr:tRNA 2-thiouridine(34) synthase MnmA [Deltaproteobacteria bacterium]